MVYAPNVARKKSRRPSSMKTTMLDLWRKAEGACHYCRRATLRPTKLPRPHSDLKATIDHVVPLSKGGAVRGDNVVLACALCNNLKADMMPEDWAAFMAANPIWWRRATTAPPRQPQPRGRKMGNADFARWLRESAERKARMLTLVGIEAFSPTSSAP